MIPSRLTLFRPCVKFLGALELNGPFLSCGLFECRKKCILGHLDRTDSEKPILCVSEALKDSRDGVPDAASGGAVVWFVDGCAIVADAVRTRNKRNL
jgi:hypothetical protein